MAAGFRAFGFRGNGAEPRIVHQNPVDGYFIKLNFNKFICRSDETQKFDAHNFLLVIKLRTQKLGDFWLWPIVRLVHFASIFLLN